MKRYKLKKDTPCAKAGIVFEERVDEFDGKILINEEFKYKIIVDCVNNFDDWLEEIPEHKRPRAEYGEKYHYINDCGDIVEDYEVEGNIYENKDLLEYIEKDQKIEWKISNSLKN